MSAVPKKFPSIEPDDVVVPEGKSLGEWIESRTARYASRTLDWDALKFQADYDPIYRRAQMRYIGTGATGVSDDENVVPAENFTFSTMVLPAGCEGPLHIHRDAEEVFFILKGHKVRFFIEHKGDSGTLGGFILELTGRIPKKGERVDLHNYAFIVEASDDKRVRRVKIIMHDEAKH